MASTETLPVALLQPAYDLGTWLSVELLPGGKSQHYCVTTETGRYVLRRSYRSKTQEELRFEHELMAYVRRHGLPAPQIMPTRTGETYVEADGRLYRMSVFVQGSGYQPGNFRQLREVAHALARYHQIVPSFQPSVARTPSVSLHQALRERLSIISAQPARSDLLDVTDRPQLQQAIAALPLVLETGSAVLRVLERVYPELPMLVIHAGCRRGSAFFDGDRLVGILDFDSAHLEARVLDLAIALHDFGKVYGDPHSPEFKVPLNTEVVAQFLAAYQELIPLEAAEIEALPALLAAKRLKRAFGRYERLFAGQPLSQGDITKIGMETARVHWLNGHREELHAAVGAALGMD